MLHNQSDNIFYVYKHTFANGAIYIGKGKNKRSHDFYKRGELWLRHYRKYGVPNIEILKDNMIETDSFKYEVEAIVNIKKLGAFLLNHTNGGEGMSGHIHSEETKRKIGYAQLGKKNHMFGVTGDNHHNFGRKWSAESRNKMSNSIKGRKLSEQWKKNIGESIKGANNGNFGREFTKEHRDKISKSKMGFSPANKGVAMSQEQKNKLSIANSGINHPRIDKSIYIFKNNELIEISNRYYFYKKYNLKQEAVCRLVLGDINSTKGWIVSKEAMPLSYKERYFIN